MNVVRLHLLVLHFPIALLIVGALLQVVAVVTGNVGVRTAARISLMLGALGAAVTAWTGNAAEEIVERVPSVSESVLERHEEIGMWTTYLAAGLLLVQVVSLRARGRGVQWGIAALAIVTAMLVGLAGFTGGKIRHDSAFEGGKSVTVEPFVPVPEAGRETDD